MVFLCLAILCSCAIALFMRLSTNKVTAKLSMLSVNYLICALLGAAYAGFDLICPAVSGFSTTVALGAVGGILYLVSFILLQWNTGRNGIVLSSVFMKLGLLVPMTLSVLVFRELPTWSQVVGFCIALLAIVLINVKKGNTANRFHWELLVLLLTGGGSDAMSKVFEALGPAALSNQFLFYIFAVALVLCVALVIYKKERPGLWEVLFGAAIGIPNFFSSKFLLRSLADLPAVVVYPSFSIATILITTLVGVCFFKERLRELQWLALAAIVAALFLLNI
jgi:drug/metabolite transporter (DMT)-like permease